MTALRPGATIGILGGGQLGRMLSVAASRLGYKCAIYEPGGDCPASHVANYHHKAAWDDVEALTAFGGACDVVTYEWENVPGTALDVIGKLAPIHPGRRALEVAQDRLTEKDFLTGLGLRTARYRAVADAAELRETLAEFGGEGILKTRTLGYDGKGQVRLSSADEAEDAMDAMGGAPAILEAMVPFEREVSVIAARGPSGEVVAFDPGENVHAGGILRTTTVPATLSTSQRTDAALLAGRILNALDYVGVLGVELFVTGTEMLVNEIAPRVHNSGHWTQLGCATDQFEQHIRAIAGLPLGDGARHADVRMENLIGYDMDGIPAILSERGAQLHLYGKAENRAGRKMGHVNRLIG
ncbi:5-(carboxyamino)imidazole ribonucleotide synthase [Jannaschia aquimarina]|uniref:N5-carboxyaminoimidazole ribonucleotide synthase n=1 Tax=Jannaschia aquimarina TaxID=935700 RepID=A0A0D1CRQ2_9RHOB|nr:5-(carboxyamino)imidazole ribonucleotide synthase [Jannaschia aquimarina]KIT17477.1 N5-carboxyaminoimidazole ribonucleotide synthase [Jannaschia aquimarina]SNS75044.1 5-(carboxyamino)imidazole ribonucleotide synthase [Jannaschia aquimarina]